MMPNKYENYYKNFEPMGRGLTLENMFTAVSENRAKFSRLFERLADPRPLQVVVLGSAAKRNLADLSNFIKNSRKQGLKEKITIIDKTALTLSRHAEAVSAKTSPPAELVQADMNALPFADNSAGLILADSTLNLNQDFQFVKISLKNIARVIENQGLFLGSIVTALEAGEVENSQSFSYIERPFDETYFPLKDLEALARSVNLFPRGHIAVNPRPDSKIEVTYFLMQKVAKEDPKSTFSY